MSVKSRILIPMVIIAVLAASLILFLNVMQFSSFVDNYIDEELDRAILKTIDEMEGMKMKSHTAILYYSNDDALISAMELGEQDAVLKRTEELFSQTNVESLTIVDVEANVLSRGHNSGIYGDDTSDIPVVQAALEGQSIVGAGRGISTSVSVRAAAPIYNRQGRLLGALFAGDRLDTDKFVDRLKTFTGCEITVLIDDMRVATTLRDANGSRLTNTALPGYIEKALSNGDEAVRTSGYQGLELLAKHTPILNSDGDIIGIISAGKFLDEKQNVMTSFIMTGFLVSVVFIAISVFIIIFVSRRIAAPINQSIGQANYDGLTGIFNRRFFEQRLKLLLKSLSHSGGIVSLMMIDIDFFKDYNDTYGHIKGDDCLKAVAAVLTQTVSRADDFVARYGGDEFVAVLPNTGEAGARAVADDLLEGMRKCMIPHKKGGTMDYVTISIGVTTARADQVLRSTDLIGQADLGLYESKRNGRGMYTFMEMK